jgi:hypothetical protein
VDRWTWIDIVRRAKLGRTVKGVAFLLATYADNDGTRVFPGIATVAVAAEVDYKTAKQALQALVKAGLLERVSSLRRRGSGSEYKLILADVLLERTEVLSPAQFELAVETVRDRNRSGTGHRVPRTRRAVRATADPVQADEPEASTGNGVPPTDSSTGRLTPQYGERRSAVHNHYMNTGTTSPTDEEVRTAVTATRAREADEKPILRLVTDDDRPKPAAGNGFCVKCYAVGKVTVAADPAHGSACATHLREEAS